MENLAYGSRKRVIEELAKGREIAIELRRVLNEGGGDNNNNNNNGSSSSSSLVAVAAATPFAEKLVKEVLMSFTNSLSFLNDTTCESHEVVSDLQQIRDTNSKSEDSLESNCKSSIVSNKERRGCYKRRKTSQTWEKESEFPVEDGHQWRKYGQKMILNAQYPRSYYRCTHKYDQGCRATKQVQRIQEDPPLHKTTYCGHHTCRNLQNPEIIVDSVSPSHDHSSMFLSFDNSLPTPSKQDRPFFSLSSSSVKRECKEEEEIAIPDLPPSSSSLNNDYLIPSDLTFDDNSQRHHATLSTPLDDGFYDSAELDDVFGGFLEIR